MQILNHQKKARATCPRALACPPCSRECARCCAHSLRLTAQSLGRPAPWLTKGTACWCRYRPSSMDATTTAKLVPPPVFRYSLPPCRVQMPASVWRARGDGGFERSHPAFWEVCPAPLRLLSRFGRRADAFLCACWQSNPHALGDRTKANQQMYFIQNCVKGENLQCVRALAESKTQTHARTSTSTSPLARAHTHTHCSQTHTHTPQRQMVTSTPTAKVTTLLRSRHAVGAGREGAGVCVWRG